MIRIFLISEIICFVLAALVHSGILVDGFEHQKARIAESVIAVILFIGLILTLAKPEWTKKVGLAVQVLALLGTVIGLITIAIGIGPQTIADIVFHAAVIFILVWGLFTAKNKSVP